MTSDADTILFPRKTAGEKAAKPIVVVVGCGFGGLQAAHHLVRYDIEVVLIDRTNHHLFQPLLYQVSMAALSPADIASPIRALLGTKPNVSVILGEVEGVDKDKKLVVVKDTGSIPYDYLILATGSAYAWFGHDEWADHAAVLKTLPDALQIRRRILEAFDWAESRTDPDEVRALTSFVVIGGGPTGVELVGSLAELAPLDPEERVSPHRPRARPHRSRRRGAADPRRVPGTPVRLRRQGTARPRRRTQAERALRIDRRARRDAEGWRADRSGQRVLVRRHQGRTRRPMDRRRGRPQQRGRGHQRLLGARAPGDLRDRRRLELQDGGRQDLAGAGARRQAGGRLCRQGDRQPDRRAQTPGAVQVQRSRHNGGDRPLDTPSRSCSA